MENASEPGVVDQVQVSVPAGGRVLVFSDVHLGPSITPASAAAASELARVVDDWAGPGVVVLAGNVFEMVSGPNLDVEIILAAHPRLKAALQAFVGQPDRRIVCLAGNRDSRLAWDCRQVAKLCRFLRADVAFAVELEVETGRGSRRIRVEHGHQLDPSSAFADPRNPHDTPLAQHVVAELVPGMLDDRAATRGGEAARTWLAGLANLDDPMAFPAFVASRVAYRRVARHLRWLLVPLAVALLLKIPLVLSMARRTEHRFGITGGGHLAVVVAVVVLADLLIVLGALFFSARRVWAAATDMGAAPPASARNDTARAEARVLAPKGWAGFVTGHTHNPELTVFGDAFYANTGSCSDVVTERPARFGMPPVFRAERQLSWLEIEAGAELHARLVYGSADLPGATRLERLVALRSERRATPGRPCVVAAFPQGPSWPAVVSPMRHLRRVRRVAAAACAATGIVDLLSAVTPPLRQRLDALRAVVPLVVPQAAAVLVALAGLALLLLARGIRRGQRHAFELALALLTGSAVLHVLKGLDPEESAIALVVAGFLAWNRAAFRARTDRASVLKGFGALVAGGTAAVLGATAALETIHPGRPHPPIGRALRAVVGHLVGANWVEIPGRVDDFLSPVMLAVSIALVLAAGWLLFRPVAARRFVHADDRARARDTVERYGGDTLAYFALRDDKQYFFWGSSLVAYAVVGGIALVSPDPIGPVGERDEVWTAFRHFADEHAWPIAVMGASEPWLPVYRATGMHDLYVGDEAVVDVQRLNLEGGKAKGLRQAVNRVAKCGYTIRFYDPATIDAGLRAALCDIMSKSRRGDVERGFSMTLGRVFDPRDRGLLLAVAYGPNGAPAAFCQYVPAPDINGYSLDLMRRADDDGPNGVTDYVVVETIRYLREQGRRGLALNFATMRAVLAGESGDGITKRVERWLLQRMSDSMQIESLWYFNAKYDPEWRPRYAVYDATEHLLPAAMAVARAESFWELPLIGRFLVPSATPSEHE